MKLPSYPVPGEPVRAAWGRQLVDYLREITLFPGPGVRLTRSATGTTISSAAASGRASTSPDFHPWKIIRGVDTDFTLLPGLLNNIVPSNMYDTFTAEIGDNYVYLEVTLDAETFQPSAVCIAVDTSVPANPTDDPPAVAYGLLAIVTAETDEAGDRIGNVAQLRQASLWCGVESTYITCTETRRQIFFL